MFIDLYNYAWCCVTETGHFPFLYPMKLPHTDFNQSQTIFQAMPSNTGLTLVEHHGRGQSKYTILHISHYQNRCCLSPSGDETVLAKIYSYISAYLPINGVCSARVNQKHKNQHLPVISNHVIDRLCRRDSSLSSTSKYLSYPCHLTVEKR